MLYLYIFTTIATLFFIVYVYDCYIGLAREMQQYKKFQLEQADLMLELYNKIEASND